jgi:hypothetical protein
VHFATAALKKHKRLIPTDCTVWRQDKPVSVLDSFMAAERFIGYVSAATLLLMTKAGARPRNFGRMLGSVAVTKVDDFQKCGQ